VHAQQEAHDGHHAICRVSASAQGA
jgi:hypothetical protein